MDGISLSDKRVLRQSNRRHPVSLCVWRRDGKAGNWRSINISEGGCFISGGPWLEPGEQLQVALDFTGGDEIVTLARVAWVNPDTSLLAKHLPAGMGLQFIGVDDALRTALRQRLRPAEPTLDELPEIAAEPVTDDEQNVFRPGTMLGPYRVIKALGSGGMGTVYLAEHETLGRRVALKALHQELAHDPVIVRRFFDEARAVNQINHQNIVAISDFCTQGEQNFFVMELLEGQTLSEAQLKDGTLQLGRVLHIARQLARALGAAHDHGITHRDLKPDNVFLVSRDGERDFVKLLDFGIAKLTQSAAQPNKTATGLLLGTPGYIAPEQILGQKADYRADIYAFGVLLYQLMTGKKPFIADTWPELLVKHTTQPVPLPRADNVELPEPLVALVMCCLEKKPELRPSDMHTICRQLDMIAGDIRVDRPAPPKKEARSKAWLLFGGGVLVTAVLVFSIAVMLRSSARPAIDQATAAPAKVVSITSELDMLQQLLRQHDYAQAAQLCQTLLPIAPSTALIYRGMSVAQAGLGQKQAACEAFRHYQREAPLAPDLARVERAIGGCR